MSDAPASIRDTIALGVYDARPFVLYEPTGVMERGVRPARRFTMDEAPAFYRDEVYELADAIHARLLLTLPAAAPDEAAAA
ncbi:hypothetical protein [Allosphingosinicella indica]|uniref:Uncharacterized protein n=1 Tax=Allosphingosinicella indica TaxID=941907 RepID=A0A1X7GJE8_9SPHN|nr:hypothetical protein [Allosphingosinicella indica]SMF70617.1 hypothetical protein SAMN06295910_1908 [Allosphingosinicella indica]